MTYTLIVTDAKKKLHLKRCADKEEANLFVEALPAGSDVIQLQRVDQLKDFGEKRLAALLNLTRPASEALTRIQKTPDALQRVFDALRNGTHPDKETRVTSPAPEKDKPTSKKGRKVAAEASAAVRVKDWSKVRLALGKNTARENTLHGALQKIVRGGVSNGATAIKKVLETYEPPRTKNYGESFVSAYLASGVRRGYLTAESVE